MKKIYTEEQRNEILQRYRSGEKVAGICEDTGITKSTIYEWTKINFKYSQNYSLFISRRQLHSSLFIRKSVPC